TIIIINHCLYELNMCFCDYALFILLVICFYLYQKCVYICLGNMFCLDNLFIICLDICLGNVFIICFVYICLYELNICLYELNICLGNVFISVQVMCNLFISVLFISVICLYELNICLYELNICLGNVFISGAATNNGTGDANTSENVDGK
ncbi:hypothetical protein ACJX0J_031559, partial [Zea mays]